MKYSFKQGELVDIKGIPIKGTKIQKILSEGRSSMIINNTFEPYSSPVSNKIISCAQDRKNDLREFKCVDYRETLPI